MIYSDADLVQMQAEALFLHDANGKLLGINEPGNDAPAPRFFLSRTKSTNLWRTRYDLPIDLAAQIERLAADEPVVSDLLEAPRHAAKYAELLSQHAPVIETDAGPAYYLLETDLPHDAVIITPENIGLLEAYFPWLLTTLGDYAPVSATIVDGNAVAVCFCSRITAKVCEAGVHTEDAFRGHGYATNAVRGWAAAIHSSGRLPLYDTSWDNKASQAIARKLGGVQYGANFSIT